MSGIEGARASRPAKVSSPDRARAAAFPAVLLALAASAVIPACSCNPDSGTSGETGGGGTGGSIATGGTTGVGGTTLSGGSTSSGGVTTSGGTGGGTTTTTSAPLTACQQIAPGPDAATTRQTIQDCLKNEARAWLSGGTYLIDGNLQVPAGAELLGTSAEAPLVQLHPSSVSSNMVALAGGEPPAGTHTRVAHLRFDANNAINEGPANTVLDVESEGGEIDDVDIFNNALPPPGKNKTGVYFLCESCKGNLLKNSRIYNHFYGVLFRSTLTAQTPNRVADTDLHDTWCDGVTFIGYGEVVGGTIHDTGFDCRNGPIPGAAIYSLANKQGALVSGVTMTRTCGNVVDIDGASGIVLEKNTISEPGYDFGGAYPYCGGGSGVALLDVDHFTIDGNDISASSASPLTSDPNQVFSKAGAPAAADLPAGLSTSIAFWLGNRPGSDGVAVANSVTDNAFHAFVAQGGLGLGFFTTRGTGYGPGKSWSAQTTNYFTGNTTFGSNVGSVRCGGDWFAGNSTCDAGSPPPCNDDDYQHAGAFHNDNCPFY